MMKRRKRNEYLRNGNLNRNCEALHCRINKFMLRKVDERGEKPKVPLRYSSSWRWARDKFWCCFCAVVSTFYDEKQKSSSSRAVRMRKDKKQLFQHDAMDAFAGGDAVGDVNGSGIGRWQPLRDRHAITPLCCHGHVFGIPWLDIWITRI